MALLLVERKHLCSRIRWRSIRPGSVRHTVRRFNCSGVRAPFPVTQWSRSPWHPTTPRSSGMLRVSARCSCSVRPAWTAAAAHARDRTIVSYSRLRPTAACGRASPRADRNTVSARAGASALAIPRPRQPQWPVPAV